MPSNKSFFSVFSLIALGLVACSVARMDKFQHDVRVNRHALLDAKQTAEEDDSIQSFRDSRAAVLGPLLPKCSTDCLGRLADGKCDMHCDSPACMRDLSDCNDHATCERCPVGTCEKDCVLKGCGGPTCANVNDLPQYILLTLPVVPTKVFNATGQIHLEIESTTGVSVQAAADDIGPLAFGFDEAWNLFRLEWTSSDRLEVKIPPFRMQPHCIIVMENRAIYGIKMAKDMKINQYVERLGRPLGEKQRASATYVTMERSMVGDFDFSKGLESLIAQVDRKIAKGWSGAPRKDTLSDLFKRA